MLGTALFLVLTGLFKKAVISDYIALNFVDRIFDEPLLYSGFECLMGIYGYALQIYCDFSGYSDMAIGLALAMGFRFPKNFDAPYRSATITEFWRRWHISLSSWLRDYLYISLGGNRKGKGRTYLNLLLTMLLGGLWHGAAIRFILWGALHGVALALHKMWLQVVFPCAATVLFALIAVLAGKEMFYKTAIPVWIWGGCTLMHLRVGQHGPGLHRLDRAYQVPCLPYQSTHLPHHPG